MFPNNLTEKSWFGFSPGNLGVFKNRNYKYFEYKKVNLVLYYNSMVLIKWFLVFNML